MFATILNKGMQMNIKNLALILVLLGLASALNIAAAETVGRVLVSVGEISATRNGKEIPLNLGSVIESGDVLHTGATSNAQVRMTDGGIIALRPQTELHLDDYHFNGKEDGTEKNFFSLIKGGFRTITGLIGKVNHSNYAIKTTTATIGIRGTDFSVVICAQNCGSSAKDGLYGGVFSGQINVSNQGGNRDISRTEGFYVPDAHTPPQILITPPSFVADKLAGQSRNQKGNKDNKEAGKEGNKEGGDKSDSQVAQAAVTQAPPPATSVETAATPVITASTPYVATENISSTGGISVLPTTGTPIAGMYLMTSFASFNSTVQTFSGITGGFVPSQASATTSGSNLTSFNNGALGGGNGTAVTIADQGSAAVGGSNVYWGRWLSNGSVTISGHTSTGGELGTGVQYVFGDSYTSPTVIAAKSGSVTYTFAGGPRATDNAGNVGTTMSGSLGINFTARTVAPNISYTVGGSTYNITGFTMPISGSTFGTGSSPVTNTGSCTGGGCSGGAINELSMGGGFIGGSGTGVVTGVATSTTANSRNTSAVGLFKAP
jgi:hypothetical protein